MLLQTILNRVQKQPGFVFSKAWFDESTPEPQIMISVVPRKGSSPRCSGCRKFGPGYDLLGERLFAFVPLWGIAVFFAYRMRRVNCETCGVKVEWLPWADGKQRSTITFLWFLAMWAKRLSWKETGELFGANWKTVFRAVRMAVEWGRENLSISTVRAIGVDEICWRPRQKDKFATLVYQLDEGERRLLYVAHNRKEGSLRGFFSWLAPPVAAGIQFVCSDMWKPYLKVIREKLPQAVHLVDRFHIAQHLSKAIDTIRREDVAKLRRQGKDAVLRDCRWSLLRSPENRTAKDEVKLKELVRHNLRSVRACLLRWDLDSFWDYLSPTWAGRFLDVWYKKVMRSRLEPLKKVAKTIRRHQPYLMAWFKARNQVATGAVEGLNNKAKVATRRAYGFRTFRALETALYHALGKLPEPTFTHRFW